MIRYLLLLSLFFASLFADAIEFTKVIPTKNRDLSDSVLVELNFSALTSKEDITIYLPNIGSVEVKKRVLKERNKDDFTWFGNIVGESKSSVILTLKNSILYGKVQYKSESYELTPNLDGTYIFIKEDTSRLLPFNDDGVSSSKNRTISLTDVSESNSVVSSDNKIDLLVLYTQNFSDYYGAGKDALIQNYIDIANEGFSNSEVNSTYNLIHSQLYIGSNMDENYTINSALNSITDDATIERLRGQKRANMVILLRKYNDGSVCGLAWLMSSLTKRSARNAYNVVEVRRSNEGGTYYCSDVTLAHEAGHNLGCAHDRDHASNPGLFSYSYGYDVTGEFATIMSYDSPTIYYYSNPNVLYNNMPTGKAEGDSESADCARTINATKDLVANNDVIAEPLESTDSYDGNITGQLETNEDRDSYEIRLGGDTNITGKNKIYSNMAFYINLYDSDRVLIKSSNEPFSMNLDEGNYTIIASHVNDDTGSYYSTEVTDYTIDIETEYVCAQVITLAYNPTTGDEQNFSTPCDVPTDWIVGAAPDFDGDGINDIKDSDDDNDGMLDEYESNTTGLDPFNADDANSDNDSDGDTNLEEYNNGTDVNNPLSRTVEILLNSGWNLISSPMQESFDINKTVTDSIDIIYSYKVGDWYAWTKDQNRSELSEFNGYNGYWVHSTTATTLSFSGTEINSSLPLSVDGDWHMMGSFKIDDMSQFLTQNPSIKVIWSYGNEWRGNTLDNTILKYIEDANITKLNSLDNINGFIYK